MGENVNLPKSFIKDIPLPKDAQVFMAGENETGFWFSFSIHERLNKIYSDYFASHLFEKDEETLYEDEEDELDFLKIFYGVRKEGGLTLQLISSDEVEISQVNVNFEKSE